MTTRSVLPDRARTDWDCRLPEFVTERWVDGEHRVTVFDLSGVLREYGHSEEVADLAKRLSLVNVSVKRAGAVWVADGTLWESGAWDTTRSVRLCEISYGDRLAFEKLIAAVARSLERALEGSVLMAS